MATAQVDVRRIRPLDTEYAPYYGRYTSLVPDGDIVGSLDAQTTTMFARWSAWSEAQGAHRYAPGKWSVRQVVGHLADAERVFAYRAMRFARMDPTPLPGFDENAYVANASFDDQSLASLVREWRAVHEASVAFFGNLSEAEWGRTGTANGQEVSVRALAWIVAGHTLHHDAVLTERYGL